MSQTLLKVAADFSDSLLASVNAGDTTAELTTGLDAEGEELADGLYGITVDNNSPQKEYIVAQLTGTELTGVMSISVQGAATSGFSKFHRKGATVEITDWAALSRIVNNLDGTTGLNSAIPLYYDAAPVGLTGNQIPTVDYVLSVVNGGTVVFSQQILSTQTAGENLTIRDHVYFKESDQRWYKVDADLTATYQQLQRGIALATATTGNALTIAISGPVTGFVGLTAGSKYYASNTAGAIATSAGTNTVFVGWALSTTELLFSPYGRDIPYGSEKDALAGTVGTPSSSNLYVTAAGTSSGAIDQSQTTQTGTFSAGEADATTRHNKLAQSFIPTKTLIKSIRLFKAANTGTFTGTVSVAIQADSAGSPSGVNLAANVITNATWLLYAASEFVVQFSSELAVTPGNTYWIVISTSTSDTSNCINLGTNTAGGYANGSAKYNNTTDGWVAIPTIDLYFKTNEGFSAKAIDATSTGAFPTQIAAMSVKTGLTTLSAVANTAVAHGLGKIPTLVRASWGNAASAYGAYSSGSYMVSGGTYVSTGFTYNEATSGQSFVSTTAIISTTNNTGGGVAPITIVSVDENVVVFSTDANISQIIYEVIG